MWFIIRTHTHTWPAHDLMIFWRDFWGVLAGGGLGIQRTWRWNPGHYVILTALLRQHVFSLTKPAPWVWITGRWTTNSVITGNMAFRKIYRRYNSRPRPMLCDKVVLSTPTCYWIAKGLRDLCNLTLQGRKILLGAISTHGNNGNYSC